MEDSNKDINPFLRLANEFRAIKSPVNYRIDSEAFVDGINQLAHIYKERIKALEQDKAELRSEIKALKESKRAAAELIYSLEARNAKLTEALKRLLRDVSLDWYVHQFSKTNPLSSGVMDAIPMEALRERALAAYAFARQALATSDLLISPSNSSCGDDE